MTTQLVLPLSVRPSFARDDFVIAGCNAQAVAFVDSWPDWPVAIAAIYGPTGSGKTHLASIWQAASGAGLLAAGELEQAPIAAPLIIEDVDQAPPTSYRDGELFRLMESASPERPILLTGREAPATWPTVMPDLASRFSAMLSLPVWAPGEELLMALARKLLSDRQVSVPDPVMESIIHFSERSPGAVRDFIAKADAKALAEGRAINFALVRELIEQEDDGLS